MSEILWTPSDERVERSNLYRFMRDAPGSPDDYGQLWRWSIDDLAGFWQRVWQDAGVVASAGYERVMGEPRMPGTQWFPGARLNFAENLLRRRDDAVALVGAGEGREDETLTWAQLYERVARAQQGLRDLGVGRGDRVAAYMPNCPETVVAMLATAATGAVFSSCSPDFGTGGVVDRFGQIEPKVLLATDGYRYGGKGYPVGDNVAGILERIDSVEHLVTCEFTGDGVDLPGRRERSVTAWDQLLANDAAEVAFEQLPFDHPLYVLYSSGTTGTPKSIVHSAGGTLLKHLQEHRHHVDLHPGEDVFFWFTTTGWMMWNYLVTALASETTVVCYDGSPAEPGLSALWEMAERHGVTHFGTSPKFLSSCDKAGVAPGDVADLSRLRSVLSTGSPLNPDQFDWVYRAVKRDLQLASVSGGTDIVACFVGGNPLLPVRRGELQCRLLGMAVEAYDDGEPVYDQKGELVCTRPFPSLPLGFWDDPGGERYHRAYFADHPGVWTHGDFIEIRSHGGVVIHGRSDTTLNPGGVRIGTAEIYRAIEGMDEIADAIVFDHPTNGDTEIVLCVVLVDGAELDDDLAERIRTAIRQSASPRHVPRHVFAVADVPRTYSGKKVEKAVRQLAHGEDVGNREAIANPEALDEFAELPYPASTGREGER
ncbi:MAG: acetoacetate--CoA ligase [Actinomycetota bacterium]|nr:acetoacetate--CoA ligase [Actinomycetota bacterium]